MWLASISTWRGDRLVPTEQWGRGVMNQARRAANELLAGVGQPDLERGFRMIATLCVHRAVSDDELAACPADRASHLAGPAVEELWRTDGYPELPLTAQRCHAGAWEHVTMNGVQCKLPGDCGRCPPCAARAAWDNR